MKWMGLAALLISLAPSPALCASYDDLNAGIEYWGRQEWDLAISRFDRAIAAADLSPGLMRVAYLDRGRAFENKKDHEKAIENFTAALALSPGDREVLIERAFAQAMSGREEGALADLQTAHARDPKHASLDFQIGLVHWQLGRYDDAATAFAITQRVFRYGWLWLQLTNLKLQKPVDDKPFGNEWGGGWPDPILRAFHGNITETAVIASAKDNRHQLCQAHFYFSLWREAHGDREGAETLMRKAVDTCPDDDLEKRMAVFELSRQK